MPSFTRSIVTDPARAPNARVTCTVCGASALYRVPIITTHRLDIRVVCDDCLDREQEELAAARESMDE